MLARHGIHTSWANEALDDPERIVITPDLASRSGRGVRTIGWSYSANRILTVITLVDNHRLYGVNAW
ncbi:MAG: transposase, partial [Actinomycetota bacterium]|nr:transposase [Actinomycetota bacterium]